MSGNQLVIYDVKVGNSFDAEQLVDYGKIVEALSTKGSEEYLVIKKFLSDQGIDITTYKNVEMKYIVLDGGQGGVSKAVNKIKSNVTDNEEISDEIKELITVMSYE